MPPASTLPSRVTMAAVAKEAGVARTTVSFVLNGQAERHGISPATAARVLETAERLRFIPNEMARALSRQRTGLIGVFLPGFNSAWAAEIVRGLRSELFSAQGYVPLIASQHDDPDWEEREIQVLLERQVEAVVCCPTVKSENYRRIVERGIPLVFVGHRAEGIPQASFVAWDGPAVAHAATKLLISRGRKRIAYLGRGLESTTTRERHEGHAQCLREHGIEPDPALRINVPDHEDATPVVRKLFKGKNRPDGLVADLWIQAVSALEALDSCGCLVPRDVAVIALGDSWICRHRRIELSTFVEPAERIGQEAARIALHLIQNPGAPPVQKLIGDYELVERATT